MLSPFAKTFVLRLCQFGWDGAAGRCCFAPAAGNQPREGREPQPVGWPVTDSADLAAQHGVLVPQHQKLCVLGRLPPGQHCQAAQQAA